MGAESAAAMTSGGSSIIAFIIPAIIWGILGLFLYFIPTLVAYRKEHIQKKAILILNIFLGWTFIGWVVALIWSVLKTDKNE